MTMRITPQGIQLDTFEQILQKLVDEYKGIYGQDIDLSQDTADGQRVGIEARLLYDLQQVIARAYADRDPDQGAGEALYSIAKLSGIRPQPESKSSWDLKVTCDYNLTVPQLYQVQDEKGQKWETREAIALTAGDNTVTFYAQEWGAVQGSSTWDIEPVTIVLGVTSVVAEQDANRGRAGELDNEFRVRRTLSVQNPAFSVVGSLYSRLANLTGVTDLQVYENDSNVYDSERDMVANSIWVVVEGGDVDDIIRAIAIDKTGGTPNKGTQSGSWTEILTKPNGDPFYYIHEHIKFDRPDYTDLEIRMDVTRKEQTSPADTALIKQLLSDLNLSIGEPIQANELYDIVYRAGDNFIVTNLEIQDTNTSWTDGELRPDYDAKYVITDGNITITEYNT